MRFRTDDRGVQYTVSHALTFGITAILMLGLLSAAGTLLHDQQTYAVRQQLTDVGGQLADHIHEVGRLDQLGTGGGVTLETTFPARVAGEPYRFVLAHDAGQDTLVVEAPSSSVKIEFRIEASVRVEASVSTMPRATTIHLCESDSLGKRVITFEEGDCA